MSVWSEVRRRNVFKVAAAYAVLAWLLIQVAGVVFPQLNLPVWAPTLVTVLLFFGFPVAVFLAWAYEVTPEGVKRTRHVPLSQSVAHVTGQRLNYAVTGLLVVAVTYIAVDTYVGPTSAVRDAESRQSPTRSPEDEAATLPAAASSQSPKVAILPCENLSPDEDDAFLAEGIHLEIHSRVSSLSQILNIARTSVLRYADDPRPPSQVARELDAQAVMECTVRYAGDNILVTATLIDPATDTPLMSESYPGDRGDVNELFAMQADIAMRIANALNAEFSPAEQATIERVPTESPAAYARYLRARDLIAERQFGAAIRELEAATDLDPAFAEAYAHKARLYAYGQVTSEARGDLLAAGRGEEDFAALTLDNASRALEVYPRAGLAWTARALTYQFRFRYSQAQQAFERAFELAPNDPDVLGEYATFLLARGEVEGAADLMRRALPIDPNGALTLEYWAAVSAAAGRTQDALAAREKAVTLVPTEPGANAFVGIGIGGEDPPAAERYLRTAEDLVDDSNAFYLTAIAFGYRQIGLEAEAVRALDRYEAWANRTGVGAAEWAQYYALRGDLDRAHEWLERAVAVLERGETGLGYIALVNWLTRANPLFAEERFQRLFDRLDALKL